MNLRLDKFNELLQDLGLYHDYHKVLVENGFDNWESITYLNAATLEDMGIKEDIKVKEILACIEAASVIKDQEEVLSESSENLRPEPDLIEEVKSGNRSRSDSRVSTEGFKKYYPITENILMKGTSLKKDRKESNEKFFSRVIQMYLNEKGITHIDSLHMLPQLQSLYLYNNQIERIENLETLTNLTQLNLQGNFIRKIENLQNLKHLKKLNLSRNMIVVLEGLEYNQELEELFISHQQTTEELQFDMTSLAVISNTLRTLEADGNRIKNVSPLAYLNNVRTLSLKNNAIEDLEGMEKVLACMTLLGQLDFRENPIEKVPKVRDQIVMMSQNLENLNDKKILANERAFLMKFYNIKSNAQGKTKTTGLAKQGKQGNELAVAGNSIKEGKENQKYSDGLNKASDFSGNTVHQLSKKASYN